MDQKYLVTLPVLSGSVWEIPSCDPTGFVRVGLGDLMPWAIAPFCLNCFFALRYSATLLVLSGSVG